MMEPGPGEYDLSEEDGPRTGSILEEARVDEEATMGFKYKIC